MAALVVRQAELQNHWRFLLKKTFEQQAHFNVLFIGYLGFIGFEWYGNTKVRHAIWLQATARRALSVS